LRHNFFNFLNLYPCPLLNAVFQNKMQRQNL
jgi:hypothetical protein